jgi:hypothetical protein
MALPSDIDLFGDLDRVTEPGAEIAWIQVKAKRAHFDRD